MKHLLRLTLGVAACLMSIPGVRTADAQDTVTIVATMDNTLYEDSSGALSNGVGSHFFAGKTALGNHHNAPGGYSEALTVFLRMITDLRPRRYDIILVNNRLFDPAVATHDDPVEDDRFINISPASDDHVTG